MTTNGPDATPPQLSIKTWGGGHIGGGGLLEGVRGGFGPWGGGVPKAGGCDLIKIQTNANHR